MKFQSTLKKINWRLLMVHFIAICFFIRGFRILGYLQNTPLLDKLINDNDNLDAILKNQSATDLVNFLLYPGILGTIGMLVAFFISLYISKKKGWSPLNSIIVILLAYILGWISNLNWLLFKGNTIIPSSLFPNITYYLIVNACILIILGNLIFFNKYALTFISKNKT